MKKLNIIVAFVIFSVSSLSAQKLITREGVTEIFSETSLFTIEATNPKVASILNTENGEVVASTLVRSFEFHEALVGEHFNENYMESHLYPKATFNGKIENFSTIDLKKSGTYPILIVGKFTMHGQTNDISEKGELIIKGDKVSAKTTFFVSLENYKIKIEENYKDRINDEIKLNISFNYSGLNN